jgi:hypothetical protein
MIYYLYVSFFEFALPLFLSFATGSAIGLASSPTHKTRLQQAPVTDETRRSTDAFLCGTGT